MYNAILIVFSFCACGFGLLTANMNLSRRGNNLNFIPFSRPIHLKRLNRKGSLCKIIAKPKECIDLAERLDIFAVHYLVANVSLVIPSPNDVLISGTFQSKICWGLFQDNSTISSSFKSVLLNNLDPDIPKKVFMDHPEYDDEISSTGIVDVGEIVSQYLSLELD